MSVLSGLAFVQVETIVVLFFFRRVIFVLELFKSITRYILRLGGNALKDMTFN